MKKKIFDCIKMFIQKETINVYDQTNKSDDYGDHFLPLFGAAFLALAAFLAGAAFLATFLAGFLAGAAFLAAFLAGAFLAGLAAII